MGERMEISSDQGFSDMYLLYLLETQPLYEVLLVSASLPPRFGLMVLLSLQVQQVLLGKTALER